MKSNVLLFLILQFKCAQGRLLKATVSDKVRDKNAIDVIEELLDSCYIRQTLSVSLDWCI